MTSSRKALMGAAGNIGQEIAQVFRLDAGDADSYSGSGQTWSNLVAEPGDGENQTTYDFYRGTNSSTQTYDPTFNGTAGKKSSDEYFSFDGDDMCEITTSNTTFLHSMHKNDAAFTLISWLQTPASIAGGPLMATAYGVTDTGIEFGVTASGRLSFTCYNAGNSELSVSSGASLEMAGGSDYMVAVSLDEAAGAGGSLFYMNGTTESFNGAYSSPDSGTADQDMRFGVKGGNWLANGYRIYQMAVYNGALSASDLDDIYDTYKARYGLS